MGWELRKNHQTFYTIEWGSIGLSIVLGRGWTSQSARKQESGAQSWRFLMEFDESSSYL